MLALYGVSPLGLPYGDHIKTWPGHNQYNYRENVKFCNSGHFRQGHLTQFYFIYSMDILQVIEPHI